jgi:hypothetical protein
MDTLLYIVTYETHLTRADVLVDDIRLISAVASPGGTLSGTRTGSDTHWSAGSAELRFFLH